MSAELKLILIVVMAQIIGGTFLYLTLKVRGRPRPLLIVSETMRVFYWSIRAGRQVFLSELEGKCLWYMDWHRGIGYGYMDPPLKLGDKLYARNGKRYMKLCVYSIQHPDKNNLSLFLFRTFYLGNTTEPPKHKPEFDELKFVGFQKVDEDK